MASSITDLGTVELGWAYPGLGAQFRPREVGNRHVSYDYKPGDISKIFHTIPYITKSK